MKTLIIDCFDSFTFNIVHYLEPYVKEIIIKRINENYLNDIYCADAIILSPGPGVPSDYPDLIKLVKETNKPILGICLGLQIINVAFGGTLVNLQQVWHGIARKTIIDNTDPIFYNIPSVIKTGRYHSWVADKVPDCFRVIAKDIDGFTMAIKHISLPIYAVQFHPESILTDYGKQIIVNWTNVVKTIL